MTVSRVLRGIAGPPLLAWLLLWLAPDPAGAQAVDPPPALSDLGYMAGCWRGTFGGGGVIEEFYTEPSANLMLGTTRYLRDGRAVQFEFTRIVRDSTGIVMTPYPGGRPSPDDFRLTSLTAAAAVFESPEHDYPKRIIYRANADGTRTARIDGGPDDSEGQEWHMSPAACPTSPP